MRNVTLGSTGIITPQNAFGALPIQRVDKETAVRILRRARDGGMTYFDTARAYSDSEEKLGLAFEGVRDQIYIATKTMAKTPEKFWEDLAKSLELLRTDYVDLYQFHCADQVYRPGDGTGMYECMEEAKAAGKVRHIGITAHKIGVAEEAVESGLYETLQFPFSYLAGEKEKKLVRSCKEHNVGFICMKGLAGGLITNFAAAMAFIAQYDNALPIWGIQRESELDQWLSCMDETPVLTEELRELIAREQEELSGSFCRGCGYCMPCPAGIAINNCARMSLMLRRAPSKNWLSEYWQGEMKKIEGCLHCSRCMAHCPYELNTPELLQRNLEDYRNVLAGRVPV
ncbi:MAG: aldo/keto reductase [Oscillibacter sp.]|nr:aldo/keto reductase [Oscillibacter sp.]